MSFVAYVTHGGGPLPLLDDPGHRELVASLRELAGAAPRPRAILLVSAHWEAPVASFTGGAHPQLVYDYYGFPEPAYHLRYPAPGDPALAARAASLLHESGIEARVDSERGFDHGLFVPLSLMYPQADVPVVEMSLLDSLDAGAHWCLGQALAPLVAQGVAVIGSGSSFHNMAVLMGRGDPPGAWNANRDFEQWLWRTSQNEDWDEEERGKQWCAWRQAPGGSFSHPREEHLLPALVCAGAAGKPADRVFRGRMGAVEVSSLLWRPGN
ncbi:class III extradiol ring-cleavage dioxygenase [Alcanivorax sp. 24]|uniref:DODA-type extradiol aromatic ring-opening family dioxygenase n=1 Tax=Alcanivorax sp. 24 TaxID=2545266 RepID=UPI00105C0FEB|nr:class III extradiol ring-cleavage dioxygenase [Alcanivorax sp. 24]